MIYCMAMIKKIFVLFFLFNVCWISIHAQIKWMDLSKVDFPIVQNQELVGCNGVSYVRLPEYMEDSVPAGVWKNSRHSAGLAIFFKTDAPEIKIKYKVENSLSMPHMPSTGVSGVDLYRINEQGKWDVCYGVYSFKDTIFFSYSDLQPKSGKKEFEYRLYLPLYNEVKNMEIGIPELSDFRFLPKLQDSPIVVYGTSIVHGACASRPGMAWVTIMHRLLNIPVINLGFSGNGKLDKNVVEYMNKINARAYILDCMPNLCYYDSVTIYNRVVDAVKRIRKKHSTTILLIEHAGYSSEFTNQGAHEAYDHANRASYRAYNDLVSHGVKNLYYISHDELHFDPDSWVDYVHPSDFGMQNQAKIVSRKIAEILKL